MAIDFVKDKLGIEDEVDPLDDVVKNAKELNKELDRMATRFNEKIGSSTGNSLKDAIDTLTFGGNMATSSDLTARLSTFRAQGAEGRERLFGGILKDLRSLEEVNPLFRTLNQTIAETGTITPEAAKRINALVREMQSGKAAAQQLSSAMADLNKAKNSYITGSTNLPFMDLLTPLGLGSAAAKESVSTMTRQKSSLNMRRKNLEPSVRAGMKRFHGPMGAINRTIDAEGYMNFLDSRAELMGIVNRISDLGLEIDAVREQGENMAAEGEKFKGFL